MDYSVDAATCNSIFDDVDGYVTEASTAHDSVSTDIDNMAAACSTGKAASIGPALNDVYNRLLASAMCTAEQQTTNAAAGGREAVSAIQMAMRRCQIMLKLLQTQWMKLRLIGRNNDRHYY